MKVMCQLYGIPTETGRVKRVLRRIFGPKRDLLVQIDGKSNSCLGYAL
jgi:hypothetical protein